MDKTGYIAVVIILLAALSISDSQTYLNSLPDINSASIQELHFNGGNYQGENVTVSGVVQRTDIDTFENKIADNTGYSVYLDCSEFVDLDYGRDYKVSGTVNRILDSQTKITDDYRSKKVRKKVTYIECTKPPQALE